MAEKTEVKKVSRIKVKKKLWFKIISPKIFGNREVGESYLTSAESAIGRKLKVNLKDLTGNIKDQNAYLGLQITSSEGNLLKTTMVNYALALAYQKRMVRTGTSRLEEVFTGKTQGNKTVIIKSMLIVSNQAQRSVQSRLKKEFKEFLDAELKKTDLGTFISNLVNRKILNEARSRLKKIYPLREVAVKAIIVQEKGLAKEEVIVEDKTITPAPEPKKVEGSVSEEKATEELKYAKNKAAAEELAEPVAEEAQ